MRNSAFDYLRTFKKVEDETENLVMATVKKRYPDLSLGDLHVIFERGVSGDYGKFVVADPQTILGWVKEYKTKTKVSNYLDTGLLNPTEPLLSDNYPHDLDAWMKEVNKAYLAFLNGTSEAYFHPGIYDRMMLDGKINLNAYMKYFKETGELWDDVRRAKQLVIRDTFLSFRSNGYNTVYFIRTK